MEPPVSLSADAGATLLERAAALARHSDSPDHYTRTYLTPAHQAAARQIRDWMREAGMAVRVDAMGSVIGHYEAAQPGARTLMLGSHFDSVRNGGKYDGVLGILVPIACVAQLHAARERLPFAIEVAAFADEEGARFQTSFLASRALLGKLDPAVLERRDAEGVSLADAMRAADLDPSRIEAARIDARSLAAYVEVHIEQGPVLLEAGHAGTVPMAMRHDALAAAAEMVLAVEERCAAGGTLVGTVGVLRVKDGSGNVIPGDVELSVDIRAADDATRRAAEDEVFAACEAIARRRRVALARARTHEVHAVACAPWVQDQLAASVERCGIEPRRLPSGAGHDAMVMAEATAVGMLFVRCGAGGVSHNPAETITGEDAALAARALLDFLRHFEAPKG